MATIDEQLIALRRLQELQGEQPSMLDKTLSGAKKVGLDLLAGFGQGAGGLFRENPEQLAAREAAKQYGLGSGKAVPPENMPPLAPADAMGLRTQEFFSEIGKDGQEPGWAKTLTQGAGQGLAMPVGNKTQPIRALLASALSSATGAGAAKGAKDAMPDSPIMEKLAGLLGGAIGGFATGPRQSAAKQDIRRAFEGTSPEQFAEAGRNAERFSSVGSTTATAAEAFSPGSGAMTLAQKARNGPLDNALRQKTELRPDDLRTLGKTAMDRVNPAVDSNVVANAAGGAATGALENMNQLATNTLTNRLQGKMADSTKVRAMQQDLRSVAKAQDRPSAADAFDSVAEALNSNRLNAKGGKEVIVPVQELSFALKQLKDAAANPLAVNKSGGAINKTDTKQALNAAETELGNISPDFAEGMGDFRAFKQGPTATMRQGPIGSLADKNPLIAGQTPVARLEGLISGNNAQTVAGAARVLQEPSMTNGKPVSPTEIARAIMQQKLRNGSTNPGQTIRGESGSQTEQNLSALIDAGKGNSAKALAPLEVADQLQAFSTPAGVNEIPRMGLTNLVRPLRTADMLLSGHTEHTVQREIARLLSDSSPAGMKKLQEVAMFNPDIRKALMATAMVNSQNQEYPK